jgi:hypothetical protein
MTIILGHAALLEREVQADPGLLDSVSEITTASERAASLTRQLLTFSRKQIMQLRVVDLNELIRNFSRMLNRLLGEHIAVDLHFEPSLPAVKADAGMVEQVIMNLAVNAKDALPVGGRLSIATRPVMLEVNPRHPDRTGKFVCLIVEDNGSGMDAITLGRIFEPFFTTKEVGKGTGLGLATVYGIVEQHRGWIEVESTPGVGTVFRVYLPVADATSQPGEPDVVLPRVADKGVILVAEDEASVLGLVTTILQRGGYKVISATSGDDRSFAHGHGDARPAFRAGTGRTHSCAQAVAAGDLQQRLQHGDRARRTGAARGGEFPAQALSAGNLATNGPGLSGECQTDPGAGVFRRLNGRF